MEQQNFDINSTSFVEEVCFINLSVTIELYSK